MNRYEKIIFVIVGIAIVLSAGMLAIFGEEVDVSDGDQTTTQS